MLSAGKLLKQDLPKLRGGTFVQQFDPPALLLDLGHFIVHSEAEQFSCLWD